MELNNSCFRTNIKCPKCGESYFREDYSVCTAMYFPPIWKNGININPDGNTTTTNCTCMICGKHFSYQTKYGELYMN